MQFARDLDPQMADRFVGMYVNDRTLDYGPDGKEAIRRLLDMGYHAGLFRWSRGWRLWSSYFSRNDAPKETVLARLWQAALLLVLLPIILPLVLIALVLYFPHRLTLTCSSGIVAVERSGRIGCVLRQPDMARIHGEQILR